MSFLMVLLGWALGLGLPVLVIYLIVRAAKK